MWEAAYYIYYTKIKPANVIRNTDDYLEYKDLTGKKRKWFFDFWHDGQKIEIKGRYTPNDDCKFNSHPEVKWLFADDMVEILSEVSKRFPDWRNNYLT